MGLLDLFKNKIKSFTSNSIAIDESLGNVLLSGNSENGKNALFRNYCLNFLNNNNGAIIIKNVNNGFSTIPNIIN